jgi:hypothetical protein
MKRKTCDRCGKKSRRLGQWRNTAYGLFCPVCSEDVDRVTALAARSAVQAERTVWREWIDNAD